MKVEIIRSYQSAETVGVLIAKTDRIVFICRTLELPWKNNQRSVSCIPEGEYDVIKEQDSPKHHYPHFRILNVPGREGILIHIVNYVKDLEGCVGVGNSHIDMNGDGLLDVANSTQTLKEMVSALPDKFKITIRS